MKLRCEHIYYSYEKSKPIIKPIIKPLIKPLIKPPIKPPILQDISLEIESGERVGLTAPSGYGKTTLCKILSAYEIPQKGKVYIDDIPLKQYNKYCPVQLIWQHPEQALNPRLQMRKSLLDDTTVDKRILDCVGIKKEWMNRYPSELSGGEKQRFCIARALGAGVKFIIADEISTMLDVKTQEEIWKFLIEESKNRSIGMLIVSHKLSLLENICTKVINL